MHLKENLTFAVLVTTGGWHTDLTVRFCEYWSHQINGDTFSEKIIFPDSIDQALAECTTDYLLIQSSGHLPMERGFFDVLEQAVEEATDIFIGRLEITNDYAELNPQCLFINVPLWREHGSVPYVSKVHAGPPFKVAIPTDDKYYPAQIITDTSAEEPEIYITGSCSIAGAGMLAKQLEVFGCATSFLGAMKEEQYYFLDLSSPYREIHTETFFEKKYLKRIHAKVFGKDNDDLSGVKNTTANIVVAPAQGLKALTLAEYFKASNVVIYDINPVALELQKLIFGVKIPTLYGDIIALFKELYPDAVLVDGWETDKNSVVVPFKAKVEFKCIDVFSFEVEELIKSFSHQQTAVFDFSDIFVYPHNYYRRPLYQVQGLFGEVYSLLKSRTAPTHILGFAPGFQHMDKVEINTSVLQYDMDPSIDPSIVEEEEEELTQDVLDAAELEIISPSPTIFVPLVPVAIIVEEPKWTPPLPAEDVVTAPPPPAINAAIALGYVKSTRSEILNHTQCNATILTLEQPFEEFEAIFEYAINEMSGDWSFKVGKVGSDKKVEFSNGLSTDAFLKHLEKPIKINPKTTAKYFK